MKKLIVLFLLVNSILLAQEGGGNNTIEDELKADVLWSNYITHSLGNLMVAESVREKYISMILWKRPIDKFYYDFGVIRGVTNSGTAFWCESEANNSIKLAICNVNGKNNETGIIISKKTFNEDEAKLLVNTLDSVIYYWNKNLSYQKILKNGNFSISLLPVFENQMTFQLYSKSLNNSVYCWYLSKKDVLTFKGIVNKYLNSRLNLLHYLDEQTDSMDIRIMGSDGIKYKSTIFYFNEQGRDRLNITDSLPYIKKIYCSKLTGSLRKLSDGVVSVQLLNKGKIVKSIEVDYLSKYSNFEWYDSLE